MVIKFYCVSYSPKKFFNSFQIINNYSQKNITNFSDKFKGGDFSKKGNKGFDIIIP